MMNQETMNRLLELHLRDSKTLEELNELGILYKMFFVEVILEASDENNEDIRNI